MANVAGTSSEPAPPILLVPQAPNVNPQDYTGLNLPTFKPSVFLPSDRVADLLQEATNTRNVPLIEVPIDDLSKQMYALFISSTFSDTTDVFEFEGFNPRFTIKRMADIAETRKRLNEDIFDLLCLYNTRGTNFTKAKRKMSEKGKFVVDTLVKRYGIIRETPKSKTDITMGRIAASFADICAMVFKNSSNPLIVVVPGLPKALSFPAAPSIIPSGAEWFPYRFLHYIFQSEFDNIINPGKKISVDYDEISFRSKLYSNEQREQLMKDLQIPPWDVLSEGVKDLITSQTMPGKRGSGLKGLQSFKTLNKAFWKMINGDSDSDLDDDEPPAKRRGRGRERATGRNLKRPQEESTQASRKRRAEDIRVQAEAYEKSSVMAMAYILSSLKVVSNDPIELVTVSEQNKIPLKITFSEERAQQNLIWLGVEILEERGGAHLKLSKIGWQILQFPLAPDSEDMQLDKVVTPWSADERLSCTGKTVFDNLLQFDVAEQVWKFKHGNITLKTRAVIDMVDLVSGDIQPNLDLSAGLVALLLSKTGMTYLKFLLLSEEFRQALDYSEAMALEDLYKQCLRIPLEAWVHVGKSRGRSAKL